MPQTAHSDACGLATASDRIGADASPSVKSSPCSNGDDGKDGENGSDDDERARLDLPNTPEAWRQVVKTDTLMVMHRVMCPRQISRNMQHVGCDSRMMS